MFIGKEKAPLEKETAKMQQIILSGTKPGGSKGKGNRKSKSPSALRKAEERLRSARRNSEAFLEERRRHILDKAEHAEALAVCHLL